MDIFILKPIDLKKGNHKLFLDFNNRGEMRLAALNDAALSNNPTTAAHAGTRLPHEPGLLHRRQRVGLRRDDRQRRHDDHRSGREEPGRLEHHRPVVRVHRLRRCQERALRAGLSGGHAGQVEGDADRARAPRRPAGRRPCKRVGIRGRRKPSGCCRRERRSSRATSTSSPTPRRIPSSRRSASRRRATSSRFCATPRRTKPARPIRSPGTCVTPSVSPSPSPRGR